MSDLTIAARRLLAEWATERPPTKYTTELLEHMVKLLARLCDENDEWQRFHERRDKDWLTTTALVESQQKEVERLREALDKAARVDPIVVACCMCASKIGEPCWRFDRTAPLGAFHLSRVADAIRALAAEVRSGAPKARDEKWEVTTAPYGPPAREEKPR